MDAAKLRGFFDTLFRSRYILHLEDEIRRLEREKEQFRIDREKLQLVLNSVTPAGLMAARQATPKSAMPLPAPGTKRWSQVVAEHQVRITQEIEAEKAKASSKEN